MRTIGFILITLDGLVLGYEGFAPRPARRASEASGEWVDYDPQTIAELATLHLQLTGGERKRVKLQSADPTSASWVILARPGVGR